MNTSEQWDDFFNRFKADPNDEDVRSESVELILIYGYEYHKRFCDYIKRNEKKQKKGRHVYMITFTIDPKKVPNYKEVEPDVELLVRRQGMRKALNILKYEYVKEYTKTDIPHWHALLVSSSILKKDRFNHYIRKYGNIDISKSKTGSEDEILNYINKDGVSVKVLP